jgi:hypothetical protein
MSFGGSASKSSGLGCTQQQGLPSADLYRGILSAQTLGQTALQDKALAGQTSIAVKTDIALTGLMKMDALRLAIFRIGGSGGKKFGFGCT